MKKDFFRIIKLLLIILILTSCKRNQKNDTSLSIPLKIINYEKRKVLKPLPFYKDSILFSQYKKETFEDSAKIGYLPFISSAELNPLIEKNLINKNTLDTLNKGIYVLSGIKNGEQFYSLDLNQNNTFRDDKRYKFTTDITFKTRHNFNLDSLFPSIKIIATKLSGVTFYKDTLFARFYPDYQYFGYQEMNGEKELKKRLQIIGMFTDSYFGSFLLDNQKFKVSVSKDKYLRNEIRFARNNTKFPGELYLRYQLKDTIQISDNFFLIDTLYFVPKKKLVLKPLNIKEQTFGYKEGTKLNNYTVEDLKGNKIFLNKIANKKLMLLDFWGTWCAPCMELTPNLKELNKKYKFKLNIVSLAYQKDVKPVQEYVTENNLNWFNGIIVKGNPQAFNEKRKIIRELRVKSFPTFILVDKDFNIIFRISGGGENFEQLVDVIDKY